MRVEDYLYIPNNIGWQFYERLDRTVELEDLIQEGNVGLLTAVYKFNENLGVSFKTYAYKSVRNHLIKYIYNSKDIIRLPENLLVNKKLFREAEERLTHKLHRDPKIEEIAEEMNISLKKAKSIQLIKNDIDSLDREDDEGNIIHKPISEINIENEVEHRLNSEVLKKCISTLSPKQRQVLTTRYNLNITLQQTGDILGMSRKTAYTHQTRAFDILRQNIELKQMVLN